ncbi:unnamed protein product [Urochloa humidicola]
MASVKKAGSATEADDVVVTTDSMQIYRVLQIFTSKVALHVLKAVHLLSQIIQEILDRGGLPDIVGSTKFCIQVLVCPFTSPRSSSSCTHLSPSVRHLACPRGVQCCQA